MEVRNPTTTSLSYVGFHPTYPAYLRWLGGGTEPNNNISQLCWLSPNLPSLFSRLGGGTEPNATISQLCWLSPNLPSLFEMVGWRYETQQQHLSVMLAFTQPTQPI
ncbi:hypothetical protein [Limnospira platensis]|uniref:hypothetical protein n=2 Tax=Limnospira platensis TaxID=118562 RepID=UPI0001D0E91E|nr:hypothetical protein APPUASWS_020940 [Arthrospira platensis str. Paraca]MDF2209415.1 hypothetical protein [Arthrospira platensis NCB002]QQW31056.1 hypothetical protein AP9108_10920 [Arthrospira sp. PCC 9108]BAI90138.1 hypothetical protein NIES39_D07210 [Arthrospira platensis NIES-39]